ncbi:hypothetical protein L2E82_35735 [Cichorium intybus]|uniref:Uncharacterized protein n=1 Tax=Cichorium intybus TaxID=13427 RepID=A0ACB9BPM3_CICIN|nr:hypothetical protein L2E82_35735 [Cichorium intybus]
MQPIASSVVRNIKVEQDYRKNDDRYIPADLVVVDVAVLFSEVPDLGSMVAVVLEEPILHLPHHISPLPLDTSTVAVEVAGTVAVVYWGAITGRHSPGHGGMDDGIGAGAETEPEALVLPK